jgi:protein tyrosine/serine phosphatase
VVAAVRTIASSEGPVLVHCAAGKDRTGVVVAVALSAVGVRPEAIVADYAATGERTGALLDRLRRSPTYADDINSKPQQEHAPRPGTMTAFLEQVGARYGGAGQWLAEHGFGADGPGLLRAKLLCP